MSTLERITQADADRVAQLATAVGTAAKQGNRQELQNHLRNLKAAVSLLALDASHLYQENTDG